ncbi:MAG TPA: hypothetical protein VNB06_21050 [Thermoanaerobaculia bacterium]|nr:hypothetical protein [Thermoanaerobaculia bacterium]
MPAIFRTTQAAPPIRACGQRHHGTCNAETAITVRRVDRIPPGSRESKTNPNIFWSPVTTDREPQPEPKGKHDMSTPPLNAEQKRVAAEIARDAEFASVIPDPYRWALEAKRRADGINLPPGGRPAADGTRVVFGDGRMA